MRTEKFKGFDMLSVGRATMLVGTTILGLIPVQLYAQNPNSNVVIQWNQAALQGVRDSKLGPPMVARALAIVHTCIYDAWAAYDKRALGTQLGGSLRQPRRERTQENKNEAISFAAYRASVDLFPADDKQVFRPLMEQLGYDPDDTSADAHTPSGIGNVACDAVLQFRHHDGSNQLGTKAQAVCLTRTTPDTFQLIRHHRCRPIQLSWPTPIAGSLCNISMPRILGSRSPSWALSGIK